MKYSLIILLFLAGFSIGFGQKTNSKADDFFYSYEYKKAIKAYTKERIKNPLTSKQSANLADAYFKLGAYANASQLYLAIYKADTTMSTSRFNRMLRSVDKTASPEKVMALLESKGTMLPVELMENAELNLKLIAADSLGTSYVPFKININSPQADNAPSFYKDGILFSSSRATKNKALYTPSGESYLDIYYAVIDSTKNTIVQLCSKVPPGKFHKSTPYYSKELDKIYYILSNTLGGEMVFNTEGKNALAIGAVVSSGEFSFLLKDLSTSFYYPFYDATSERLYFAANFEDSYGGTDLYYVIMNNGQVMSAPRNLGPRINSAGNEISPYLLDGSLYFSSDIFYGYGGMDVYKSNLQADKTFTIPINLGKGINTTSDDFSFIIKEEIDNSYLSYFTSNRVGGNGGDDIYGLKMANRPGLKTISLKGIVENTSTRKQLHDVRIRILDANNNSILKEVYSKSDGSFYVELPYKSEIKIEAQKEGLSYFSSQHSEKSIVQIQNTPYKIDLVRIEDLTEELGGQRIISLNDFYFDKGQSTVNAAVIAELKKVVTVVAKFPTIKMSIASHTDSRGRADKNKELSQNRADAIKQYLIANGVGERIIIEAVGYGEEQIQNNCTNGAYCLDFLHRQNERTVFTVISE